MYTFLKIYINLKNIVNVKFFALLLSAVYTIISKLRYTVRGCSLTN